mmetsp:Transcript_13388/g.15611  ORF Transcript_13388/g.15611 Transcript_13388/m.15611 type:complete len:1147 (-) Transcript_13388:493-3933(-)
MGPPTAFSPCLSKSIKKEARSPSIPTVIGAGKNFEMYNPQNSIILSNTHSVDVDTSYADDNIDNEYDTEKNARIGISRPSYSPAADHKLDFSPILRSSSRKTPKSKSKSALENKYNQSNSNINSIYRHSVPSAAVVSPPSGSPLGSSSLVLMSPSAYSMGVSTSSLGALSLGLGATTADSPTDDPRYPPPPSLHDLDDISSDEDNNDEGDNDHHHPDYDYDQGVIKENKKTIHINTKNNNNYTSNSNLQRNRNSRNPIQALRMAAAARKSEKKERQFREKQAKQAQASTKSKKFTKSKNNLQQQQYPKQSQPSTHNITSATTPLLLSSPSEEDSYSHIDVIDGSINLNAPFSSTDMEHNIHISSTITHELLDNERFATPAQLHQSLNDTLDDSRRHRSSRRHHNSSRHSSSSHRKTSMSSSSRHHHQHHRSSARLVSPEKGHGIGISAAPKSRSSRIIVPYVAPTSFDDDNMDLGLFTIFMLLIQPTQKIFELIRINYNPSTTTLQDLLDMIPENCSEEDLSNQNYIGFTRPNAKSSSSRSMTDLTMTASVMARDGSCARIVCGELMAAIPDGYSGKETQILARHIMKNPNIVKLLNKRNPLSHSSSSRRRKRSSTSSSSASGLASGSSSRNVGVTHHSSSSSLTRSNHQIGSSSSDKNQSLGIQPRRSDTYVAAENSGTFSSSVLFAPLSATIDEEADGGSNSGSGGEHDRKRDKIDHESQQQQQQNDLTSPIQQNSCNSITNTTIYSSNGMFGSTICSPADTTNSELNYRLQKLERTIHTTRNVQQPQESSSTTTKDDESSAPTQSIRVSVLQLEEIKRDAAEAAATAAKVAAEEAFSNRMEELVQTLNLSEEEKERILRENDDNSSFHSAMSRAVNAAVSPYHDDCNFPVSVSVTKTPSDPRSMMRHISPLTTQTGLFSPDMKTNGSASLRYSSPVIKGPAAATSDDFTFACSPTPVQPPPESEMDYHKLPKYSLYQGSFNSTSMNTTFTQSTKDSNNDFESSLVMESLTGFYNLVKDTVAKRIEEQKENLCNLPEKITAHNMALKVMTMACVVFLSTQNTDNEDDNEGNLSHTLAMYTNGMSSVSSSSLSLTTDPSQPFNLLDLQQVLFWFLLLTKGQSYVAKHRSSRKKRRAWKSRVKPVN